MNAWNLSCVYEHSIDKAVCLSPRITLSGRHFDGCPHSQPANWNGGPRKCPPTMMRGRYSPSMGFEVGNSDSRLSISRGEQKFRDLNDRWWLDVWTILLPFLFDIGPLRNPKRTLTDKIRTNDFMSTFSILVISRRGIETKAFFRSTSDIRQLYQNPN